MASIPVSHSLAPLPDSGIMVTKVLPPARRSWTSRLLPAFWTESKVPRRAFSGSAPVREAGRSPAAFATPPAALITGGITDNGVYRAPYLFTYPHR